MSEGAGAVVLEGLDHARSRGANILGELLGYGSSADAYRITDTHPKAEGAFLAMAGALEDASLTADDIDYVNAHGTSHTFDIAIDLALETPIEGIVGATYPLSRWREALDHALGAGKLGTLKVAFDPRADAI